MGNVWGIANPGVIALPQNAASDLACPANTQTFAWGGNTYVAPTPANYYPMVWGSLAILLGATPPTALSFGLMISGGASVDSQNVAPALLLANATLNLPIALTGPSSPTAFTGLGGQIQLWVNPTGQAVTFKGIGTRVLTALFRGPDQ